MKKRIIYLIVFVLLVGGLFIVFNLLKKKPINKEYFVYMGEFKDPVIKEDDYVFTSYSDYIDKFDNGKLSESDFKNNNYVLIPIMYDSCSESDIKPVDYKIKGNEIDVTVEYFAKCGVCPPEYMYYLLKVDKSIKKANLSIDYESVNEPNCDPYVSYKPLIYLYPTKKMNISVKLGKPELLTSTYPKYNNGWNVIADKYGNLIDESGRTYYGLYWEGLNYINEDFKEGFVVKKEDTISFLEEKLNTLGLNEREANEFIIYWLPRLEENEYNLIRFENMDIINKEMPLYINPNPDTLIRVFMVYKPINNKINIKEQTLTKVERKGFTVVEWGGSKINM